MPPPAPKAPAGAGLTPLAKGASRNAQTDDATKSGVATAGTSSPGEDAGGQDEDAEMPAAASAGVKRVRETRTQNSPLKKKTTVSAVATPPQKPRITNAEQPS
jgi:hypothetical protein